MSNKRNDRKAIRKSEALARNGFANAHRAKCGHVHGEGVGCQGRVSMHPGGTLAPSRIEPMPPLTVAPVRDQYESQRADGFAQGGASE